MLLLERDAVATDFIGEKLYHDHIFTVEEDIPKIYIL